MVVGVLVCGLPCGDDLHSSEILPKFSWRDFGSFRVRISLPERETLPE